MRRADGRSLGSGKSLGPAARQPCPFLLALYSVPAVILGELQTPSGPLHRLQKRSEGVLPAGGKGVSCYLLDPVEDGALHLPSGLCSSGCCRGGACQGPCPGKDTASLVSRHFQVSSGEKVTPVIYDINCQLQTPLTIQMKDTESNRAGESFSLRGFGNPSDGVLSRRINAEKADSRDRRQ